MQKNKLNLHICGIHLLNPYKTVVSHLKMGFLLYDLYFDIAWPLSPDNHYIVEVVMAILLVYCLCSDFITFLWPFKTFKIAATVQ